MDGIQSFKFRVLSAITMLLCAHNGFASSNFIIVPFGTLPTTVSQGSTVSANYTVINATNTTLNGYMVQGLPATVTQNTTSPNCSSPINLGPKESCQLQLDITGAVSSSFAICKGNSCTTTAVPLQVSLLSQSCGGANGACRVFVTNTTTQGDISDGLTLTGPAAATCSQSEYTGDPIAVGNCICHYEAVNIWSITGATFNIWLSTSSVTAPTNISYNANATYLSIMPGGGVIANSSYPFLATGTLLTPIAPELNSYFAYTGTTHTGGLDVDCLDWTTNSSSYLGTVGRVDVSSAAWTNLAYIPCNENQPQYLYCFEVPQ